MIRSAGFCLVLFLFGAPVWGQLDPYKYVVVPTHFENFRKANQHQTSTVIKYLFTENGFPAIYDTDQPTELKVQPCLGAYTRLHDESGMFNTKVRLELVDCEGKTIFETAEGTSKEKDYVLAYREALRQAFRSFAGRSYSYTPPAAEPAQAAQPLALPPARPEPAQPSPSAGQAVALGAAATPPSPAAEPAAEVPAALPESVPAAQPVAAATESAREPETWYAQPIENGYQLVDSTPSIRMKLMNTSRSDTYIALVDGQARGSVFLSDGVWVHEYYEGGTLHRQALRIKF
jgi:hypothetical protein